MKNYKTEKESSLLEALRSIYPDSSNTTLRDLLKKKRVYINNILKVNANETIEKDKIITICPIVQKIPFGIELIFEDEDILVVNKPDGLLSVPLDDAKEQSVLSILRKYFNTKNIFVVHRIDKSTSGLMMFAKHQNAVDKLNVMFKNHELVREYTAVLEGNLKEDSGTWKSYLTENNEYYVRSVEGESEGKLAVTHFSVLRRSKMFTFLKLNLETGRKHQIRIHCKDAGHPILGDKRYSQSKNNPISRMCLHSSKLEFSHPITNKKMSFFSPVPHKFKTLGI